MASKRIDQDRIETCEQIPEADLRPSHNPLIAAAMIDADRTRAALEPAAHPVEEGARCKQQHRRPKRRTGTSRRGGRKQLVGPADPLVDVAVRIYADFAGQATLAEVLAVIGHCRRDLDPPSTAALPEMVEGLARQRLTDAVGPA